MTWCSMGERVNLFIEVFRLIVGRSLRSSTNCLTFAFTIFGILLQLFCLKPM